MNKSKWILVAGGIACASAVLWFIVTQCFGPNTNANRQARAIGDVARGSTPKEIAPPQTRADAGADGRADVNAADNVATAQVMGNELETARNLRQVFDQFKNSRSPVARNVAYRAWTACHPTFISPQGEPANLERVLKTLTASGIDSAARRAAYRDLYQRCAGFFDMSRDAAMLNTQVQQESFDRGEAAAPGELAILRLRQGDESAALDIVRDALASKDAYAVASLQEFIYLSLRLQRDAGALPGNERIDIRSLAYTLAACQIGLECGAESLTALRLCANSGQCEGGVADRLLQSLPNANDRAAAVVEAARVVAAIQSGRPDALMLGVTGKN
jgi:hypothetical protein